MGGGMLSVDNEVRGAPIVCKQWRAPPTLLSVSIFRRPWPYLLYQPHFSYCLEIIKMVGAVDTLYLEPYQKWLSIKHFTFGAKDGLRFSTYMYVHAWEEKQCSYESLILRKCTCVRWNMWGEKKNISQDSFVKYCCAHGKLLLTHFPAHGIMSLSRSRSVKLKK